MHVSLQNVTKKYGKAVALGNVTLDLEPGSVVALLGRNGAGKTTMLRALCGVAGLNQGQVLFDGQEFQRARIDQRRRFFVIPDVPAVFPYMTPIQYAGMVFKLYNRQKGNPEEDLCQRYAELEILPQANKPLGTLSRGQLYKAVLAALVTLQPELWLLDEPFASGMDPGGLLHFKRYVKQAREAGCTIIYSTQILEVNYDFCDRIILLDRGEIVFQANTRESLNPEDADRIVQILSSPAGGETP